MKTSLTRKTVPFIFLLHIFCSFQLFNYSETRNIYDQSEGALEKWGQCMAPRFGLAYIGRGGFNVLDEEGEYKNFQDCYAINFASRELLTQEQGRAFIIPLTKAYWTELDQNPVHNRQQQFLAANSYKYKPDRSSRITQNMIGIKVTFWDPSTERPLKPYLAQIRVFNNKIQYFYTDPTTKRLTRPPVEEPLEL